MNLNNSVDSKHFYTSVKQNRSRFFPLLKPQYNLCVRCNNMVALKSHLKGTHFNQPVL